MLLPYDKAELFAAKLELSDQPMVTWQAYKTRPGETLAQVAARFGMPLETLRTVNGIGARADDGADRARAARAVAGALGRDRGDAAECGVHDGAELGARVYHRVAQGRVALRRSPTATTSRSRTFKVVEP